MGIVYEALDTWEKAGSIRLFAKLARLQNWGGLQGTRGDSRGKETALQLKIAKAITSEAARHQ